MKLYLLDPSSPGLAWQPFTGVRPVAYLRAGTQLIHRRWSSATGMEVAGVVAGHAAGFVAEEPGGPQLVERDEVVGPAWVADASFAPTLDQLELSQTSILVNDGRTVAWRLAEGDRLTSERAENDPREIAGQYLAGTASLLDAIALVESDALAWPERAGATPQGAIVLGDPALLRLGDAEVEPGVVFDLRTGPVILDDGVVVQNGTRLEGPCYVGPATRLLGGTVRGSIFGNECRVRGEVSASVFLGYGNKAHDGFVGHSVVGCWVNLGAMSTTSNLKNTYGTVSLEIAGEKRDSGRQFLGSLLGDHCKTAIGTMLQTGTVVGAGANVFGAGIPPRYLPPMAWGVGGDRTTLEGFLKVAARVMRRRRVAWDETKAEGLSLMYRRLTG